jgi:hypothetical protein
MSDCLGLKPMMLRFAMLLPLVMQYGCSSESSRLSEAGKADEVQFIIMGGNATCQNDEFGNTRSPLGTDIHNSFKPLLEKVEADGRFNTKWIVSCHRNSNAAVHYATSESMNQVFETTPEQFISMVNGRYLQANARSTFMAGHSYGGWLTMKTALAAMPEQTFDGVFTIDPISRVHCTFSSPIGCTSAPRDITNAQRTAINEVSGFWGNYYQTNTFYLHSAPMEEADYNLKLDTSHTAIDNHEDVWTNISETVFENLAMSN